MSGSVDWFAEPMSAERVKRRSVRGVAAGMLRHACTQVLHCIAARQSHFSDDARCRRQEVAITATLLWKSDVSPIPWDDGKSRGRLIMQISRTDVA
jgi:hypothetical protein